MHLHTIHIYNCHTRTLFPSSEIVPWLFYSCNQSVFNSTWLPSLKLSAQKHGLFHAICWNSSISTYKSWCGSYRRHRIFSGFLGPTLLYRKTAADTARSMQRTTVTILPLRVGYQGPRVMKTIGFETHPWYPLIDCKKQLRWPKTMG